MDTPLISVVMPIYNVQDYLAWSVKSVLDQSYPHFELICVDDGSTDDSGDMADQIAIHDDRIRVIHQQNGGLSAARNTGIKHATGEVIIFLDSDDALRIDALQTIAATYVATSFDVLTYGAVPYPSFEASVWLETILSPRDAEYKGFHPDILFKEKSHPFAWRTACRRRFLEEQNIFFDETIGFGEDQVFHFQIYPRSTKTVFISDKLVDYRVKRSDSLMATRFNDLDKRAFEHLQILDTVFNDWLQSGFLAQWPREIFDWSVDFMIPSLMLSEGRPDHATIVEKLAQLWRRYFDEVLIIGRATDKTIGPIVSSVLDDAPEPSRIHHMRTLFVLRRRAYGLPYALRQAAEQPLTRLTVNAPRTTKLQKEWHEADLRAREAAAKELLPRTT